MILPIITALAAFSLITYLVKRKEEKAEIKAKGVVLDTWNKVAPVLAGVGVFVATAFLGITQGEFDSIFEETSTIVGLIDTLVTAIIGLWATLRALRNPQV